MKARLGIIVLSVGLALRIISAERINHDGRILGPPPVVTVPLLFNTSAADSVVAALQIFPTDNPWNEDISRRPILPNSDAMIARIQNDLLSTRRTLRLFKEMNFVLVPEHQFGVPIDFIYYSDESDPSPYPLPPDLPVEGWPSETVPLTLEEWQRDIYGTGGDRHTIVVQPGSGGLWETWLTRLTVNGWEAANGAKFNIYTNGLRPAGWTSGDAAGLPMFPALVRYDECRRGKVEHAVRLVVKQTRAEYLYPARHFASVPFTTDPNVPAMGQRLRLKSSFVVPDSWTLDERAVVYGLKKYGAIVADNGNFFSISITPDDRWAVDAFSHINSLSVTNFEVIQTTGPAEGPRSLGAPSVYAGADFQSVPGIPAVLQGNLVSSGGSPTVRWRLYSGPGSVSFDDATRLDATALFESVGTYVLLLSAEDGVHAPAYDAVTVVVGNVLRLNVVPSLGGVELRWQGGKPPYVLEGASDLGSGVWSSLSTNVGTNVFLATPLKPQFFRVKGS